MIRFPLPTHLTALFWLFVIAGLLKLAASLTGIYGYSFQFGSEEQQRVLRLSVAERIWTGSLGLFWLLVAFGIRKKMEIAWNALYHLAGFLVVFLLARGFWVVGQAQTSLLIVLAETAWAILLCFLFRRWWRSKRDSFSQSDS